MGTMSDARTAALPIGLAMLAVLCGPWFLWRSRLRRMSTRMELRLLERQHAYAWLYDALLQDVQGLTLTLQSVADRLPPDEPAREALEHALVRADQVLAAGRERGRAVRMSHGKGAPGGARKA
jgi:hypothetical protein